MRETLRATKPRPFYHSRSFTAILPLIVFLRLKPVTVDTFKEESLTTKSAAHKSTQHTKSVSTAGEINQTVSVNLALSACVRFACCHSSSACHMFNTEAETH